MEERISYFENKVIKVTFSVKENIVIFHQGILRQYKIPNIQIISIEKGE